MIVWSRMEEEMKKITQMEEESTENQACNTLKAAAEEDKEEKRVLWHFCLAQTRTPLRMRPLDHLLHLS